MGVVRRLYTNSPSFGMYITFEFSKMGHFVREVPTKVSATLAQHPKLQNCILSRRSVVTVFAGNLKKWVVPY